MKIVKVKGGLGNQMFQYAFHRLLQEKYRCGDVTKLLDHQYFDGYWQSRRYLEPIKDQLKKEFTCDSLSDRTRGSMERFGACESVFVGVRRGDYFDNWKLGNPLFIFFSNDMPWVKEHLNPRTLSLEADSVLYREQEDIVDDGKSQKAHCRSPGVV